MNPPPSNQQDFMPYREADDEHQDTSTPIDGPWQLANLPLHAPLFQPPLTDGYSYPTAFTSYLNGWELPISSVSAPSTTTTTTMAPPYPMPFPIANSNTNLQPLPYHDLRTTLVAENPINGSASHDQNQFYPLHNVLPQTITSLIHDPLNSVLPLNVPASESNANPAWLRSSDWLSVEGPVVSPGGAFTLDASLPARGPTTWANAETTPYTSTSIAIPSQPVTSPVDTSQSPHIRPPSAPAPTPTALALPSSSPQATELHPTEAPTAPLTSKVSLPAGSRSTADADHTDTTASDSNLESPPAPLCTTTKSEHQRLILRRKEKRERRIHTKSRNGCFNCKKRRIRCQETLPACGHCVKANLPCEYPAGPQLRAYLEARSPKPVPRGYAAADLAPRDSSLLSTAFEHRAKAMQSMKKMLDGNLDSLFAGSECNALFATCIALMFQALRLDDGMTGYMTFIRGMVKVYQRIMMKQMSLMFDTFADYSDMEHMRAALDAIPLVPRHLVEEARTAVENLAPLCQDEVSQRFLGNLREWLAACTISSFETFRRFRATYSWWHQLSQEQLQRITQPGLPVLNLLSSHWLAASELIQPLIEKEIELIQIANQTQSQGSSGQQQEQPMEKWKRPQAPNQQGNEEDDLDSPGFHRWLRHINKHLDPAYVRFNQWPLWVESKINEDIRYFGRTQIKF